MCRPTGSTFTPKHRQHPSGLAFQQVSFPGQHRCSFCCKAFFRSYLRCHMAYCSIGNMSECQYLIQQPQMHPDSNGYSPSTINIQPAHHQRQWSGSSTNNSTSYSFSQHACAMEEDGQSATPIAHHNGPSRSYNVPMLSHSNSAPDLRLLLSTSLPEAPSTVLPNDYSYAGAMVPYKGPQVRIERACFIFCLRQVPC